MAGFDSIISTGLGLATGNPFAIAAGVGGLAMSIMGGVDQTQAAKEKAAAEKAIAGFEMQQDSVRRRSMELQAKRQQMEVLRNAQRARSLALQNATTQGANLGSGLQGGYGQIAGAANWNNQGITQNLSFGEQMFDLNSQINQQKMKISDASSMAATGSGLSSIGKTLMGSYDPIKTLTGNAFGSSNSSSSGSSGGSYGSFISGIGSNGLY